MHRMRIDALRASGFPEACPGCGGKPDEEGHIALPSRARFEHPVSHIRFPACAQCKRKELRTPWIALALGLLPFFLGFLLAGRFEDPDKDFAASLGIFAGVFLGPIAFAVAAERTCMLRLHDWGPSLEDPDWVEVSVRYPGYAAAPRRGPKRN